MPLRPMRDTDSAELGFRIRAFGTGAWFGLFGIIVGVPVGARLGLGPLVSAALGFVAGAILAGGISLLVATGAGRIGRRLYMPGSGGGPPTREYSLAESLSVRGRYAEAAAAWEDAATRHPHDPTPCIMLGRLLRDSMDRPDDAVVWLRRARARRGCDDAGRVLVTREIVEIFRYRMRQPERALPDLARLADGQAGTPAGDWARAQMVDIRSGMT